MWVFPIFLSVEFWLTASGSDRGNAGLCRGFSGLGLVPTCENELSAAQSDTVQCSIIIPR
jgi:hypothetical protein